jgi:CheY-like chemotaxis protein
VSSVDADVGQLQQVVMNLVLNAAEAVGERAGRVTLLTGDEELGDGEHAYWRFTGRPLPAGPYVRLEVRDDGAGMDARTLGRIFDPFFTTKFTGRGLGLAAVLGIVRGHGGGIDVATEPGRGTSIRVVLPRGTREALRAAPPEQPAARAPQGPVLVVDDEELVLGAACEMLKELGRETLAARSGPAALVLFAERRADIALVRLDLSMPDMDGPRVFAELRRIDPEVRVVLTSGYDQVEATRRFDGLGLAGFLQKPYSLARLDAVLGRVEATRRQP